MIRVTSRGALADVRDRAAAMNAPQLPLFAAAADRRIALAYFGNPVSAWQNADMERLSRPCVVLVGDDPDIGQGEALGPEGWAMACRLRYWARAALIHGAAGEAHHYRAAVKAAERVGRVALVETSAAHAAPWGAFLRCPNTLFIMPSDGVHPVAPAAGVRQ